MPSATSASQQVPFRPKVTMSGVLRGSGAHGQFCWSFPRHSTAVAFVMIPLIPLKIPVAEVLWLKAILIKNGVPSVIHEVKALLQDVASSDGVFLSIFSDLGGYRATS